MIRLTCPVCGGEQEALEGREFVFCKFCGTHMNVALCAADAAASAAAAVSTDQPDESVSQSPAAENQPAGFTPSWPVMEERTAEPAFEPTVPAEPAGKVKKEKTPKAKKPKKEKPVKAEKTKKKGKGLLIGIIAAVLVLGGAAAAYFLVLKPANDYKAAEELMAAGSYSEAADAFEALGDYKDAKAKVDACLLQQAIKEVKSGKYTRAAKTIKNIGDSALDISDFDRASEEAGADLIRQGKIEEAEGLLETLDGHIKDLQDAVRERFTLLFEGENASAETYEEAGRLLKSFEAQVPDKSFVAEVLGRKVNALIEKEDYSEAVELLGKYQDLNLDVSGAVGTAVKTQLENGNYSKAASLPGLFGLKDLDVSEPVRTAFEKELQAGHYNSASDLLAMFSLQDLDVSEPVKSACEKELQAGNYNSAAELLALFGLQDLDVSASVKAVFTALLNNCDYSEAADLLTKFQSQNLDMSAEVQAAFMTNLENGSFSDLFYILRDLPAQIPDVTPYENAVREKMTALAEAGEDWDVMDLYQDVSALNADALLADAVNSAMQKSVEASDGDRINTLMDKYSTYVENLGAAAEAKVAAMIEAGQFDEALAFIGQLDSNYFDVKEDTYQIALKLMDEGELFKAYNLFNDLGDYSDSEAMKVETTYRIVLTYLYSLSNGTEPTPDGLSGVYTLMKGLGDYKDTPALMDTTLGLWLTYVMDPSKDSMAFAEAMNNTVLLSEEEKALLLERSLAYMPDLVWYEDGVRKTYDADAMEALLYVLTIQLDMGTVDTADAFMNWLDYLCAPSRDVLPTVEDMRTLWEIRSDMPAICADNDPLLLYLTGSWVSEDGEELLKIVRTEEDKFRLTYGMPRESVSGYLRTTDMGFSVVDEEGNVLNRICTITIVGLDVIEVHNENDNQDYTLQRAEE